MGMKSGTTMVAECTWYRHRERREDVIAFGLIQLSDPSLVPSHQRRRNSTDDGEGVDEDRHQKHDRFTGRVSGDENEVCLYPFSQPKILTLHTMNLNEPVR